LEDFQRGQLAGMSGVIMEEEMEFETSSRMCSPLSSSSPSASHRDTNILNKVISQPKEVLF
jgi:hypothetical protein